MSAHAKEPTEFYYFYECSGCWTIFDVRGAAKFIYEHGHPGPARACPSCAKAIGYDDLRSALPATEGGFRPQDFWGSNETPEAREALSNASTLRGILRDKAPASGTFERHVFDTLDALINAYESSTSTTGYSTEGKLSKAIARFKKIAEDHYAREKVERDYQEANELRTYAIAMSHAAFFLEELLQRPWQAGTLLRVVKSHHAATGHVGRVAATEVDDKVTLYFDRASVSGLLKEGDRHGFDANWDVSQRGMLAHEKKGSKAPKG